MGRLLFGRGRALRSVDLVRLVCAGIEVTNRLPSCLEHRLRLLLLHLIAVVLVQPLTFLEPHAVATPAYLTTPGPHNAMRV